MAIEDTLQSTPLLPKQVPPVSLEDEKKAQQELARFQKREKGGFEGKTLWDWLQLLGVPLFLACATIGFSFVQFHLADQQHASDQRIANQQHAIDQQNALDQQHATTLQTYIDNIQELLLKENLRESKPDGEVAILARARTLTALQGLDPIRKGHLVQFLYEAQLIGLAEYAQDGTLKLHHPIIDLSGADLSGADLSGAFLNGVNLFGAILFRANLSGAYLLNADLFNATLFNATLRYATLGGTNLNGANLRYADLTGADLDQVTLRYANLTHANLSEANLDGADLFRADLFRANLNGANLTQQQLDQVYSCKDATLPKGLLCHNNP